MHLSLVTSYANHSCRKKLPNSTNFL